MTTNPIHSSRDLPAFRKGLNPEIPLQDIVYLQGDGNYTIFHLFNGKTIVTSSTLGDYEAALPTDGFLRIHKSYLINTQFPFKRLNKGIIRLSNGSKIEVSRRRRRGLINFFKNNS